MGERIRRLNAKQIEKILKKYGFELISQKGSHKKWRIEPLKSNQRL